LLVVDPGTDPDYETYDDIVAALEQAVADGVISQAQISESLTRVLRLRASLGTP
ncbi:MAG: beta-glucosidase-like glycosyl hydrolase, partial [Pontimonas sp.]